MTPTTFKGIKLRVKNLCKLKYINYDKKSTKQILDRQGIPPCPLRKRVQSDPIRRYRSSPNRQNLACKSAFNFAINKVLGMSPRTITLESWPVIMLRPWSRAGRQRRLSIPKIKSSHRRIHKRYALLRPMWAKQLIRDTA